MSSVLTSRNRKRSKGRPLSGVSHRQPSPVAEVVVIEPQNGWAGLPLRELWRARELIHLLVWRDIKVRYKQTLLGAAWVILQPLLTTGAFTLVFSVLLGPGNEPSSVGVPYVLATFCGMLPWQLFARALGKVSESLIANRAVITKVYFPRLVFPIAGTAAAMADVAVVSLPLALLMLYFRVLPGWQIISLPVFTLLALAAALGAGLWLAALSARYRDFLNLLPVALRLGLLVSPVAYSATMMVERLHPSAALCYCLNPMVTVIEGFRWALLSGPPPTWTMVLPAVLVTCTLLTTGLIYFRRTERVVTDVV